MAVFASAGVGKSPWFCFGGGVLGDVMCGAVVELDGAELRLLLFVTIWNPSVSLSAVWSVGRANVL